MNYPSLQSNKTTSIPQIILVVVITLYMIYYIATLSDWHFIDNVNLIFHEAGHVIFSLFGNFVNILGGTLMQILIPTIFSFYFYKNQENFSASLLLFWLSQNFFNISVYAGDAIKMELPLLGGNAVSHDWNSLLSMMGILKYTDQVAGFFYFMGIIVLVFAVVFSLRFSIKRFES